MIGGQKSVIRVKCSGIRREQKSEIRNQRLEIRNSRLEKEFAAVNLPGAGDDDDSHRRRPQ